MQRRTLLASAASGFAAVAGCITGATDDDGGTPTGGSPATSGQVAALTVSDFVTYPLSGTHPHVHRRANTQYVIVRVDTARAADTVRNGLTLELDGETQPLADRQPVPWEHETVDVAFAVPKDVTVQQGRILLDGTRFRSLSEETLVRLNNPPAFDVTDLSVAPTELQADERTLATVTLTVTNSGAGRGTFGASLTGNFLSGSETVTATIDPGGQRTVTGSAKVVGEGKEATVRLDWGTDTWSRGIPVTEAPADSDTPTTTSENPADEDRLTGWERSADCERTPTGMYDSVIEVKQVVEELGDEYVPIRFSELTPEETAILRTVTEEGGYATCDTSGGFLRFIERVGTHREQQRDSAAEDMHIYLERDGTYYRLYVEKLDEVYAY
jgi:hypothetical protein